MNAISAFMPDSSAVRAISEAQDALIADGCGVSGPVFVAAYKGAEFGDRISALMPADAATLIRELTGLSDHHVTLLAYGLRSLGLRVAPALASPDPGKWLTPRQAEIMGQLSKGRTNKEIARAMGLHEVTVKLHMKNIMHRLGARNRVAAVLIWKGGVA